MPRPRSLVSFVAALLFAALPPAAPQAAPVPAAPASNCAGTSTGRIPLNDLGAGFYQGVQGGLYPGGSNHRPAAHEAAGLTIANSLGPLDTLGNASASGRVVVVSIGLSNTTQEFSAFVPKCTADPVKRANVVAIDCAVGGQTASIIRNPAAWYWDSVATRLRGHGSSPAQVQVVWFKEANAQPTGDFATSSGALANDIAGALRTMKAKLPNAKLCYVTSRIYAGYATSTLNPEPYAYESAFAVKSILAAQIAGEDSLNFDAAQGPVVAPWLSWGPYLWADGLSPRSDGLTWACSDFSSTDGTHPSVNGREKVADSLLAFFRADGTTVPWYRTASVAVAPAANSADGATLSLHARPLPATSQVELLVSAASDGGMDATCRLVVLDTAGRRVRDFGSFGLIAWTGSVPWDLRDDRGRRVRAGVYWARAEWNGLTARTHVVVR